MPFELLAHLFRFAELFLSSFNNRVGIFDQDFGELRIDINSPINQPFPKVHPTTECVSRRFNLRQGRYRKVGIIPVKLQFFFINISALSLDDPEELLPDLFNLTYELLGIVQRCRRLFRQVQLERPLPTKLFNPT